MNATVRRNQLFIDEKECNERDAYCILQKSKTDKKRKKEDDLDDEDKAVEMGEIDIKKGNGKGEGQELQEKGRGRPSKQAKRIEAVGYLNSFIFKQPNLTFSLANQARVN